MGRLFCCLLFLSTVQRVRNEVMPKKTTSDRRTSETNGVYDLRTPFPIASDRFPELLVRYLYLYLNILRIHEVLQLKFGNLEAGRACNEIHLALQCNNKKRRLIGIDFNYYEKKNGSIQYMFQAFSQTL